MKVFVYGTLKQDYHNSRLFDKHNSVFLREKVIPGYKLYYSRGDNGFPVAKPDKNSAVRGEVWDISNNFELVLRDLDFLESEGFMYNRKEIEENLFMYVGHPDNWPWVEMVQCPSDNNIYFWENN